MRVSTFPWVTTVCERPLEDVEDAPERPAFLASLDQGLDRLGAHALDRPEAEIDLPFLGHAELAARRR